MRRNALVDTLKYYEALGFERLPLDLPETGIEGIEDRAEALQRLRGEIGDCQRCGLSKGRTHLVFGEGNPEAILMFIGEGPGQNEDIQGRPFVGDAGDLLGKLIARMGFRREEVYIGNVIKCRPPQNRNPEDDEVSVCGQFIRRQIAVIRPKIIMALGKFSAHYLLDTRMPISKLRGRFGEYQGIAVMPTFHPAYLLRNPQDKTLVWQDALKVLDKLGRKPVEKPA